MKIRLHQFLSKCGIFSSKSEVKKAIWDGEITVNGSVVKNISFEFKPNKKIVMYQNKELYLPTENVYFLLNKPSGYICSRLNSQEKEYGKISIYEIFREAVEPTVYESLITVGRLDEETTGFLLVTTDGKMVHKITNPNNNIKKTYYIEAMELITKKQIDSIKMGVRIIISDHDETQKYTTRPAIVDDITDYTIKLTIDEGKKREIRRMFHSIGNEVDTIHRISTENMQLSNYNLEIGDFCKVTIQEINELIFD
ncbi:MAG: pseudouridine synthase [Candidatus Poseidoniales archaeon]|jgi:16S rRNA pseudouridine516 synthase|tara:strand:+ start:609 stop:1370 length:762 start_codon:yes stop_codon:yes gene_type:complete